MISNPPSKYCDTCKAYMVPGHVCEAKLGGAKDYHNPDEDGWCQNEGCMWNSWNAISNPKCPTKLPRPPQTIDDAEKLLRLIAGKEALPNPTSPDLAEPTDANPTPLPVKPSLEDKPTISFDEKTFNQLLAEAEQRGYQKGFKESVRLAPCWAKIREENEDAYLAMVETVTKAEVAWSKTLDLAVREARKKELEVLDKKLHTNTISWKQLAMYLEKRIKELKNE